MSDRKGIEMTLSTIIVAIIVLVVLVVMVSMFTGVFNREREIIEGQIDATNLCGAASDFDQDGIQNSADSCRCIPAEEKNDCTSQNHWEGCPSNSCEKEGNK